MRRAGFDYADPLVAHRDPVFQGERPSGQEIAMATADVRCKKEVDLVRRAGHLTAVIAVY